MFVGVSIDRERDPSGRFATTVARANDSPPHGPRSVTSSVALSATRLGGGEAKAAHRQIRAVLLAQLVFTFELDGEGGGRCG